ncbi:MAG: glycosyl hydrolase family 28 protein [Bryobacteraceae bacterium]|jgi:hypothetical protein
MRTLAIFLLVLAAAHGRTCDIRDYGALRPGEKATAVIQAAIDACSAAGGGTVNVPPGTYQSGAIRLKDNTTLHLEAGAVLTPTHVAEDYPRPGRALVYSDGAKNIGITGRGAIDGQARYKWGPDLEPDPIIPEEIEIARKAGVDMNRWLHEGLTINAVRLRNSTDVLVEGVSLVNSSSWTLVFDHCNRVRVHGIRLESDLEKALNADGIDIVSSRNVVISDSIIFSADDTICLKTEGGPVENVAVTNCLLSSSSCAFKIGSRTNDDVRHVVFSNSVIRDTNRGFGIQDPVAGTVSDVLVSNITIELNRRHWNWWGSAEPISITLNKRPPAPGLGQVRDIVIENVVAHARGTSRITGLPERDIESITLRNIDIYMQPENKPDKRATRAIWIQNVKDCRLRDVRVRWEEEQTEPKWASAIFAKAVGYLDIDGFVGRQGLRGSDLPVMDLQDIAGGWIRGCRALPGSGTFFRIGGSATKQLRFGANELTNARQAFSPLDGSLEKLIVIDQR